MRKKELFLNEEEPHLKQTILPPNDLSETRSVLPQFKQILLELITNSKVHSTHLNYIRINNCLLYTSPSPRDATLSRMPSSA